MSEGDGNREAGVAFAARTQAWIDRGRGWAKLVRNGKARWHGFAVKLDAFERLLVVIVIVGIATSLSDVIIPYFGPYAPFSMPDFSHCDDAIWVQTYNKGIEALCYVDIVDQTVGSIVQYVLQSIVQLVKDLVLTGLVVGGLLVARWVAAGYRRSRS